VVWGLRSLHYLTGDVIAARQREMRELKASLKDTLNSTRPMSLALISKGHTERWLKRIQIEDTSHFDATVNGGLTVEALASCYYNRHTNCDN